MTHLTQAELEGCFKLLRSYWPGDWDEARYLVWAHAFDGLDADHVRNSIIAMANTEKFPTVAAFRQATREATAFFAPGTGKLRDWDEIKGELEAEPTADTEAAVIHLAEMRKRLRGVS